MIRRAKHLFVVEDDTDLRQMLAGHLERHEFAVTAMASAEELLDRVAHVEPDLILLDIGLPGMDGLSACRWLRERGMQVPVIVLSARAHVADRAIAIEIGADDYLVKPYAVLEVLARIKGLLRRAAAQELRPFQPSAAEAWGADGTNDTIAIGNRLFSNVAGTLTVNGRTQALTRRQCALLHELATNAGRPVPRERLHRVIQRPGTECSARMVDSMIRKLRRLIEPDAEIPRHLRTVRGSGYVLLPNASADPVKDAA